MFTYVRLEPGPFAQMSTSLSKYSSLPASVWCSPCFVRPRLPNTTVFIDCANCVDRPRTTGELANGHVTAITKFCVTSGIFKILMKWPWLSSAVDRSIVPIYQGCGFWFLVRAHIRINQCRQKTIKIIDENTGSKISDIALSSILSAISSEARETKEKKINGTTSK